MTYRELLERLNRLDQEQLDEPARWWSESDGGEVADLLVLEQEYVNVGEGMEPRGGYAEDFAEDDVVARLKAGTPVLAAAPWKQLTPDRLKRSSGLEALKEKRRTRGTLTLQCGCALETLCEFPGRRWFYACVHSAWCAECGDTVVSVAAKQARRCGRWLEASGKRVLFVDFSDGFKEVLTSGVPTTYLVTASGPQRSIYSKDGITVIQSNGHVYDLDGVCVSKLWSGREKGPFSEKK